MKFNKYKIKELLSQKISGEWGNDPIDGEGVFVIRSTNFTNEGVIKFSNVIKRSINPKIVQNKKILINDIIIEKSGGSPTQPVGRVVFFNKKDEVEYLCNNFTTILRANSNLVYPRFLFYVLYYFHLTNKTLKYQNKTTGIINLKLENYLEEEISIPDNYNYQIKISNVLDKASELIQMRKTSLLTLDNFMNSLFLETFGDPRSNSKGWNELTLPQIAVDKKYSIKRGPFGGSLKKEIFVEDGYLVYEQFHAINDDFSLARYFIDEKKYKELEMFKVVPGDLIISCSGVTLGRIAEIPSNAMPGIINQALLKISLNKKIANNTYFKFLFRHSSIQDILFGMSRGSGIPNFPPMGTINSILFPIPNIDLQNSFSLNISKAQKTKSEMLESLNKIEALYQSLLSKSYSLSELELNEWTDLTNVLDDKQIEELEKYNIEVRKKVEEQKAIDKYNEALKQQFTNLPPVKGVNAEIEVKIKQLEQEFSITEEMPFDSDYVRYRIIKPSSLKWPVNSVQLVDTILSYKYYKEKPTPDNIRNFFFTSLNNEKPFLKQIFDDEKGEIIFDLAQ